MGKVVEKKKKKGRPSLLDLQKRNLREQQQQQQKPPNPYSNPNFRNPVISTPNPNPNRGFTRRNPKPDGLSAATDRIDGDEEDYDEDDESIGKRREKKLKLVLRLPSDQQQKSSLNSPPLNSGSYSSDSNAEDRNGETPQKKRKISAVGDGSGHGDGEKGEKPISASKTTDILPGALLDSGPATPLPDKKLLVFILDRLQKKDTYSVFSEPVDPKELPDYHEVIEHPMDFGTVRKKLAGGAYAYLEQFEKDIFLICSNAMRYNAPDTIYFRQARSIQELAKKNFENLRQDSDENEQEPKIVRRGRPPKKPLGRPPFERAGSEFSSDATLATGGDNAIFSNSYDLRKGPLSDKSGPADTSGRTFHGSRNNEAYSSWLAEHKSERNDDFTGSMLKGMSMKNGKKQFVLDENRRNTYRQSHPSAGGHEPSVFNTFDGEKKHLMAVGLPSEHSYTRSLARFAANLGPVAWKIASKKIERVLLPAGVKFGPGWVGSNEDAPPKLPLLSLSTNGQLPQRQFFSAPNISLSAATTCVVESKGEKLSEKHEPLTISASDGHLSRPLPPSTATSSSLTVANRSPEPSTEAVEDLRGLNSQSGLHLPNSGVGLIRPRPPFQIHQSPVIRPTMNGFSGRFGFNLSSQIGNLIRPARPTGNFSSEASMSSGMLDMVSKSNTNFAHPMLANHLDSEDPKYSDRSNTINTGGGSLLDSGRESQPVPGVGLLEQPSWRGSSLQQKPNSVPPDLNVRFQSPGSPSPSVLVDSPQTDLALQL
ncbi:hypothetical protein HHK36_010454 [Tetracentron sinense]|uniref:Bromo domain-containing protein n=1 Tax=Tetracentron sinense TaxID=13715 RepID=A0A834ZNJ1_TETSI|nr:hypothetical protein HHK36_010454 [Tetracentron sinense]